MRRLIAVIATFATALAVLTVGLSAPASADINQPAANAVLRGNATLGATGAS